MNGLRHRPDPGGGERVMAARVGTALTACVCTLASAQNYPTRPIRMIIPFTPGGSTDIYGRTLSPKLADAIGQQVAVDNRPGAGGAVGAELAAKSPPDGTRSSRRRRRARPSSCSSIRRSCSD